MVLLLTYALVALVFSFLCSIAEAVVLSVSAAHVSLLQEKDPRVGNLLREFKEEINRPLTAILTLNTIAHTVGAVGVGAQAAAVFGSGYVGIASAVLTLLIVELRLKLGPQEYALEHTQIEAFEDQIATGVSLNELIAPVKGTLNGKQIAEDSR